MQTVAAWAEQILMGTRLQDKLRAPGPLRYELHAPWSTPSAPGRPASLQLHRRSSAGMPSSHELDDDIARGEVLHHFANHELLALELMALMLLRFPDAPNELRKTLVATISDEQRHMRLYLDSMRDLGVELGQVPVNAFFWDCLAHVHDPLAFVAGMSLGFEQANLDFAAHWMKAFDRVGDERTVQVLRRVHRDEVRHVAHGVRWLRQLKDPAQDDWTAWTQALTFPMTPRRARGPKFQEEARLKAGLELSFVQRLRGVGHSRGRPPRVYWFTPWVEEQLAGHATPNKGLRALAADLAPCLRFVASDDDLVIVPRMPSAAFQAQIAEASGTTPRMVQGEHPTLANVGDRPVHSLHPWGWSPDTLRSVATVLPLVQHPPSAQPALLSRKDHAARVLADLPHDPRLDRAAGLVVRDIPALRAAVRRWPSTILKAPLSASGRHRRRVDGDLSDADERWFGTTVRTQGAVVVEPWRTRLVDLSLHATVSDNGARVDGVTRFFADVRGRYRGTSVDRWTRGLPTPLLRWIHQDRGWVQRALTSALSAGLAACPSFRGPISLDAFVCTIDGQPRLRPLVELNPRPTFGRVALGVRRQLVDPTASAVWLLADQRTAQRAGLDDLKHLAATLRRELPAQGTPLRRGARLTTDPETCERVITFVVAGSTWSDVQRQWASFTQGRPALARWIE